MSVRANAFPFTSTTEIPNATAVCGVYVRASTAAEVRIIDKNGTVELCSVVLAAAGSGQFDFGVPVAIDPPSSQVGGTVTISVISGTISAGSVRYLG